MLVPHPQLNSEIDNKYIDEIADREGYYRFIPYTFVKHLAYAFSFYLMGKNPQDCVKEKTEYSEMFIKLLSLIQFDKIKTKNPVVFAIRVLCLTRAKLNLRKIEQSAVTSTLFVIESTDLFQNYKFDLTDLSSGQLEVLGIQQDVSSEMELSDEVQKLLIFYDGLLCLKPSVEQTYDVVKEQIRSFSDFSKVRRYKFALPSFAADLGLKKLQITKIDDSEKKVSEVILALDLSYSMKFHPSSKALLKSVLLYYLKELETMSNLQITILHVRGNITSTTTINTPKDLMNLIQNLPVFTLPTARADEFFHDINRQFAGRSVVFVSDGLSPLKTEIALKAKLYSISLSENETLHRMSIVSGGQHIVLK
jgi:hypothetical protein